MKKKVRLCFFLLLFIFAGSMMPFFSSANSDNTVHFIPVEQTVERGLEAFLERTLDQAMEEGADHVVLEIDTPGGAVDAAGNIAQIIREADVPITAYVVEEALSAGAYIALNADQILMVPGSHMGSAQVVDGAGNAAEDKMQSAWVANMIAAAELNDRDPIYAQAMSDPSIDLEEYRAGEGQLLTLSSGEAHEVGYAEAVVSGRDEVLDFLEMPDAEIVEGEASLAEQLTRIITHPVVIPILLSLGGMGLIIELFSPGFGIPGLIGLSSLGLFFFGHLFAGFAGMEAVILLILGIILIALEIFFTGFGIFGVLGVGSIIGSMFLASFDTSHILISIVIAVALASIVALLLFRYFGKIGLTKKLILSDTVAAEDGYVVSEKREDLMGKIGKAVTPLRPSGSMILNDERLDVVTEGGFIEAGRELKVVDTSGSRIVVREVE